ncbi:MAG TPA: C1 family peptidase [Myxococcota bacterium]|nr:C1 family peptidase [Myxococcota bacterium]
MSKAAGILLTLTVVFTAGADAGADDGGLSVKTVGELRSSLQMDARTKNAIDALSQNEVKDLVIDTEAKKGVVNFFSNKMDAKGITNQNKSGRCWMFATLNTLRPALMKRLRLEKFEFSYNYLFFWDKLEKSNLFLEKMIELADHSIVDDRELEWWLRTPAGDGGQWNMAVDLIEKYGLVPLYAMPENVQSKESRYMNAALFRRLRKGALAIRTQHARGATLAELRVEKVKILEDVYRILALNLGVPPASFEWRYERKKSKASKPQTMTPQEFFRNVVRVDLRRYLYLMNSPNHPVGKLYRIKVDRSLQDTSGMIFANVSAAALKEFALKAVKRGQAVWFGADVGKDYDASGWLAPEFYALESLYGVDFSMDKAERLSYRESLPTHAMVFIGVDIKNGKPRKWLVENSWGDERGNKGLWTMTDRWFDEYVYALIVDKKHLPPGVVKIFEQKPVDLPYYDPVWAR